MYCFKVLVIVIDIIRSTHKIMMPILQQYALPHVMKQVLFPVIDAACSKGFIFKKIGREIRCEKCGENKFNDEAGGGYCKACPNNTRTCGRTGATSSDYCKPGKNDETTFLFKKGPLPIKLYFLIRVLMLNINKHTVLFHRNFLIIRCIRLKLNRNTN